MKSVQNQPADEKLTCPACGLLCDDLQIGSDFPASLNQTCKKGAAFFTQAHLIKNASPSIAGVPCEQSLAIQRAAEILNASNQPLIAGLGTEVIGMRAIVPLARKLNATLDHMHSASAIHNMRALQNSGWITTTFSEIKNRADLILAIGTDISTTHPRFLERLTSSHERLSSNAAPEIIYLGAQNLGAQYEVNRDFHVEAEDLPEVLAVLNAILNGRSIRAESAAGVPLSDLQHLVEKLKNAKYAVLVWSASALHGPHAALTVESITQLILKLNETTRAAGLPLSSGDGDTSVNHVSTWLTGYPTRIRFYRRQPDYNTHLYSTQKQIQHCDALLWVSTFNPISPPETNAPTIVIGHPATPFTKQPDVFIPVGIPGIDHPGFMFRMDSSITLPLKQLRESNLPTLAETISMIDTALTDLSNSKAGRS